METLAQQRQRYHRLLLQLGEAEYKEEIISSYWPNCTSTKQLNTFQMNILLRDAEERAGIRQKARTTAATKAPTTAAVRKMRSRILLVLAERGITAKVSDWSQVNKELEAKRYQWILSEEQRAKGLVNKKGLLAFTTVEDLQKLLKQLCRIRDVENLKK